MRQMKLIIFISIVLTIFIGSIILLSSISKKANDATIYRIRIQRLQEWREVVTSFLKDHEESKHTLYTAYQNSIWNKETLFYYPFNLKAFCGKFEREKLLTAEGFYEIAEYEFMKNNDTWFVSEKPSSLYNYSEQLMIDQNGKIFKRIPFEIDMRQEN